MSLRYNDQSRQAKNIRANVPGIRQETILIGAVDGILDVDAETRNTDRQGIYRNEATDITPASALTPVRAQKADAV